MPEMEGTTWRLDEASEPYSTATVSAPLSLGKGLVSVPLGAFRIEHLGVDGLSRNLLGTLKVERGPGLIQYVVHYDDNRSTDAARVEHDLHVPELYQGAPNELIAQLGLGADNTSQSLRRLKQYFDNQFAYSLVLKSHSSEPLLEFLDQHQSGHCEYFASATVLILRPARYATGYVVQEWSELEKQFVILRRHAHAWALVYADGRWQDFDTTPTRWVEFETAQASWWEPVSDLLAWLKHQYAGWRWDCAESNQTEWLMRLLLPLVIWLGWRLSLQSRVRIGADSSRRLPSIVRHGQDSAFYAVLEALKRHGFEPLKGETLNAFLRRIQSVSTLPGMDVVVDDLLPFHKRMRFYGLVQVRMSERYSTNESNVGYQRSKVTSCGPGRQKCEPHKSRCSQSPQLPYQIKWLRGLGGRK